MEDITTQAVWSQLTNGAALPPKPTDEVGVPELMARMQSAVDDLEAAMTELRGRLA